MPDSFIVSEDSSRKNLSLGTSREYLCKRCRNLHVEKSLGIIPSTTGSFMTLLKDLSNEERSDCTLCNLFRTVTTQGSGRQGCKTRDLDLYLLRGSWICGLARAAEHSPDKVGVALTTFRSSQQMRLRPKDRMDAFANGLIAPVEQSHQAFQVHLVSQEQADFSKLESWIKECERGHPDNCKPKKHRDVPGFKCIDVYTRRRSPIDSHDDYYALSYVWMEAQSEGPADEEMTDDLELPQPGTPQLIEDAFTVVKRLGGRYLWVDRYCIAQKKPTVREAQIQSMDKVYEGARATIVVAPARSNPPATTPSGIPGVSRPRLRKQPTATLKGHVLVSTLPHVSVVVAQSTWALRGWTYQEMILSKRCLIFTDVQVYSTCLCMTACESITISNSAQPLFRIPRQVNDSGLRIRPQQQINQIAPLRYLFENLQQYKSRSLSRETDSLSAFRGLLAKTPFIDLFGVPIACSRQSDLLQNEKALSIGLARGVWWECPGGFLHDRLGPNEECGPWRRYANFPSWSWAGWGGSIRLHEDVLSRSSAIMECNEVGEFFNIEFNVQYTTGDIVPLINFARSLRLGDVPIADSRRIQRGINISPVLHIRTAVHLIGVRRGSDEDKLAACTCECPVDYQQCRRQFGELHSTHRVRFFNDILGTKSILETMFPTFWGAIPLFRCKSSKAGLIACLIIDWKHMERYKSEVRGVAYLQDNVFLAQHRRQIELV